MIMGKSTDMPALGLASLSLCGLLMHGLSKDIPVSCITILFSMLSNHQIRHEATCKASDQPGDCRWPLNQEFVLVCMS